jgi:hypothetical protein
MAHGTHLFLLSAFLSLSTAEVLRVPSEYGTIQDALDATLDGDTVLVAHGEYVERLTWPDTPGIDLLSESGRDSTVVDGDSLGTVITIRVPVDTSTVIRGFTVQGGNSDFGGGMFLAGSSPRIEQNRITRNFAGGIGNGSGGGVYCSTAAPVFTGNLIDSNVTIAEVGKGGGIACEHGSAPLVLDNTFIGNWGEQFGGAIHCGTGFARIEGNFFEGNHSADGGAIAVQADSHLISGNEITGNWASFTGGALYFEGEARADVKGNRVTGNWANVEDNAIYCRLGARPTFTGNDVFGNGVGLHVDPFLEPDTVIATGNFWGDSTGPYHPTLNPTGLGDTVSDFVVFIPWATGPQDVVERGIRSSPSPDFFVVPNPASGAVRLSVRKLSGPADLLVCDLSGRVVRSFRFEPGRRTRTWTPDLLPGVYVCLLRSTSWILSRKLLLLP